MSRRPAAGALGRIVLVALLVPLAAGCAEPDRTTDEIAEQLAQIDSLRLENEALQNRSAALSDSLDALVSNLRGMMDELQRQKKLRALLEDDRVGLWEPDENQEHVRFAAPVAARTVDDLITAFNARYTGSYAPELRLLSVDGTTAFVGVSDDAQLSERMGSTGSTMYRATMVFTLTSFPGIDGVYLDIRPGSHAGPGRFTRAMWVEAAALD